MAHLYVEVPTKYTRAALPASRKFPLVVNGTSIPALSRRRVTRSETMKVAFAGSFAPRLAEPVKAQLALPCEIVLGDENGIVARLADVDVLVSMGFTAAMAAAAPRLRLLQVPGAGLDRIDRGALRPGTRLANVYGHEVGIAEYIVGAMITLTRSFVRLDAGLRRGEWMSQWAIGVPPTPLWPEIAGKTLGILGFGRIGQALARRAAAFDMRLVAMRSAPHKEPPEGVAFVVVINVARGEIFDEAALYDALASGRLAGAALDVWYRYPTSAAPTLPASRPFHELGNVLMTPHVSGWTEGMIEARSHLIAENIARTARGEPPLNAIDPAA
jgi:phosphoglycerate dehydrogenase-like enzyme